MPARKPAPTWAEDTPDVPAFTANTLAAPPTTTRKRALTISMSTVEPKDVVWFWYPYIAAGKLCTIDGDPGVGKSAVTVALTSAVTTGRSLPGDEHPRQPENVLMLNSEDDPNDTLRPRLDAMGADVTRVFIPPEFFTLDTPAGRTRLETTIRSVGAKLVVIDPIQAWMGGRVDMNKANEIRAIMGPLATIAATTGAAIVIVRHVRKGQPGEKAIHKGLGSVDGIAAVRTGLYATADGGRKLLRHIKTNIGPIGATIPFTFNGEFTWGEPFEDDPTAPPTPPRLKPLSTRPKNIDKAREFLLRTLGAGRRLPSAEVVAAAHAEGLTTSTLTRAREGLVTAINKGGTWYWELTTDVVAAHPVGLSDPPQAEAPTSPPPLEPAAEPAEGGPDLAAIGVALGGEDAASAPSATEDDLPQLTGVHW